MKKETKRYIICTLLPLLSASEDAVCQNVGHFAHMKLTKVVVERVPVLPGSSL